MLSFSFTVIMISLGLVSQSEKCFAPFVISIVIRLVVILVSWLTHGQTRYLSFCLHMHIFQIWEIYPQKARKSRHFKPQILHFWRFYSQNWNYIPIFIYHMLTLYFINGWDMIYHCQKLNHILIYLYMYYFTCS